MRNTMLWAAVTCVLIAGLSGCQSGANVVRGQSPNEMPLYGSPDDPNAMAACPPGALGPGNSMAACPPGAYGPYCNGYCDPANGMYCGPQSHRVKYSVPSGLTYPPPNQPPAVVQYPYYTVRGPTDFFYTGE